MRILLPNFLMVMAALLFISLSMFAQSKCPNMIIMLTDDMGSSDVSAFGGKFVPTPNIGRLAKNGLMLSHNYSAHPSVLFPGQAC